jgi:hypothetical protein
VKTGNVKLQGNVATIVVNNIVAEMVIATPLEIANAVVLLLVVLGANASMVNKLELAQEKIVQLILNLDHALSAVTEAVSQVKIVQIAPQIVVALQVKYAKMANA